MPAADRSRTRARRRRARRRHVALLAAGVVVIAGGASAWALTRSSGASYRLASATRANLVQTVDADGSLSATDTASEAFSVSGTVASVRVAQGQHVRAGQTLATIDRSSLRSAVQSARSTLASARKTLADDEATQQDQAAEVADVTSTETPGYSGVELISAAISPAQQQIRQAQQDVVHAQEALDGDVAALDTACTTTGDSETKQAVTADSSGVVAGTVPAASVVTLTDDTTTSSNPQTIAANRSYSFAGLTAGADYHVVVVPVVDNAACTTAIENVENARGARTDSDASTLYGAINELNDAIAALENTPTPTATKTVTVTPSAVPSSQPTTPTTQPSSGPTGQPSSQPTTRPTGQPTSQPTTSPSGRPTGQPTSRPTGQPTSRPTGQPTSRPTGRSSTHPSGQPSGRSGGSGYASGSGYSTGSAYPTGSAPAGGNTSGQGQTRTITAAQLAADQKSIDAAKASLVEAKYNLRLATLTSPISGTVESVGMGKGDTVNPQSSSQAITVAGAPAFAIEVDVSIADIDLVKVGERASVTVDGHNTPVTGHVSLVGITNTSDSSGSSSEYAVTVTLDKAAGLMDGMGASVSIDVATAHDAVTVPISAVHAIGTRHTVTAYVDGKPTTHLVETGVVGADRVQITSGLKAGAQVVIADLNEAIPDSTDFGGLGGGLGGRVFSGGGSFAGPPGGFTR